MKRTDKRTEGEGEEGEGKKKAKEMKGEERGAGESVPSDGEASIFSASCLV